MKCPKCGYLGFEHVDRCRNCGYDFSFTSRPDPLELPLKSDDPPPRPDDLRFLDAAMSPASVRVVSGDVPRGSPGRQRAGVDLS